jgi:photosystem II stability/assembly factor-like uncharacterized protein
MKKYFYKLIIIVSLFGIMGFGDCSELWYALWGISLNGLGTGFHNTTTDANSEVELYNIAVGKQGAIYTGEGRSPSFWVERPSGTTQNLNFVRVYNNPDSLITYAVGDGGTVLLSRDKGLTWVDRSIPSLTANLYGIDIFNNFTDGINVVVCGDGGVVYKSTNSGGNLTWVQVNTPTTERLNTIGAIGSDLYITAGENGTIFKTNDGGQTWEDEGISDPNADFNRLFLGTLVSSFGPGWIVGDNGKIYMTTDYGYSWYPRGSSTPNDLYDVSFRNPTDGIAAGKDGVVRYTTDGGYSWYQDTYLSGLTTRDIVSIARVDSNTASCLTVNNFNRDSQGADTTFFLSVSSEPFVGVNDDENLTLSEFRLEQNYPNPFNPSTKINYAIPQPSFVTLIVYDVLGNEVATLVNEEKNSGNYQVDFSGYGLSSGVYYYTLKAGNYSETRKLVLLK